MFDAEKEKKTMDVNWLLNNGWEINANLIYRHMLYELNYEQKMPTKERIKELFETYPVNDVSKSIKKIVNAFANLLSVKKELQQ